MDILDELKMLADHIDDENNGKPDALSLQLIGAIAEIRKLRAESERLSSMIDHQRDEAMEMERMLRAELADSQSECERLRDALEKIADWNGCYGPFPESNNELWRGMAIVTAREAAPNPNAIAGKGGEA